MTVRPKIRCAVYTRKSSDEGLDQEFNSLDAQREACEAYVASQRHEGWKLISARYDDGGISGGTLERPALRRLLADIEAGRVDMVVVYKIDRLTRSLADFARLVERLEAAGCSFVSVTQAFNTSSSMGRLTLNVLLSFAQFEREVTAERIRDKIAASKRKGLWMGGIAPLGYDAHPDPGRRELVVNEDGAAVVRHIFALYLEHRCLSAVSRAAMDAGLRSKLHRFSTGRVQGGQVLTRGQIHHVLTNPVYRGLIRHKESIYPGTHPAIVEEADWTAVQDLLQAASARRRGARPGQAPTGAAPLKGKVRDETGDLLTPSHTRRRGRHHRYYVSHRLIIGNADPAGWRLPAKSFENAVAANVARHLRKMCAERAIFDGPDIRDIAAASEALDKLASSIEAQGIAAAAPLVSGIVLSTARIIIDLDAGALAKALGACPDHLPTDLLRIDEPLVCRRRGVEMKIVAGEQMPAPDPVLVRGLRHAHAWSEALRTGTPLSRLATEVGFTERYVSRTAHLAGLSPRLQTAILEGRHPPDLTLERLIRADLPLSWREQEDRYGLIQDLA